MKFLGKLQFLLEHLNLMVLNDFVVVLIKMYLLAYNFILMKATSLDIITVAAGVEVTLCDEDTVGVTSRNFDDKV